MSSDWHFLFDEAAGFASIAGLVLSVFGLVYAYRAAKRAQGAIDAADEARKAVRRNNAGEEFRELSERAKELLRSTQSAQYEAARVRSADLLAGIVLARHRWSNFFPDESLENVDEAARVVGRVSRALAAGAAASSPEVNQKMLKSCHNLVVLLAEESGKMLKRLEGGTG